MDDDIPEVPEEVPEGFFCPITFIVMRDPVTLVDGHSYEREAIEKWFGKGHLTSPLTNQQLTTMSMKPNHALRKVIKDFFQKRPMLAAKFYPHGDLESSTKAASSSASSASSSSSLPFIPASFSAYSESPEKLPSSSSSSSSSSPSSPSPSPSPSFIQQWLARLDLGQYLPQFVEYGFDTPKSVLQIRLEDLKEMKVRVGHGRVIMEQVELERRQGAELVSSSPSKLPLSSPQLPLSPSVASASSSSSSSSSPTSPSSSSSAPFPQYNLPLARSNSRERDRPLTIEEMLTSETDREAARQGLLMEWIRRFSPGSGLPPAHGYGLASSTSLITSPDEKLTMTDIPALECFNWLPAWITPAVISNNGRTATTTVTGRETQRIVGDVIWSAGKHYFEISLINYDGCDEAYIGVIPAHSRNDGLIGYQTDGWSFSTFEGAVCHGGLGDRSVYRYHTRLHHNGIDRLGVLVDMDQRTIEFVRNGRRLGIAARSLTAEVRPAASISGTITVFDTKEGPQNTPDEKNIPASSSKDSILPLPKFADFNWLPSWRSDAIISENGHKATTTCEGNETQRVVGDIIWTTGRHYFEISLEHDNPINESYVGVIPADSKLEGLIGYQSDGWAFSTFEGAICHGGHGDPSVFTYSQVPIRHDGKDRLGVLVDMDKRTIEFVQNGHRLGVAFEDLSEGVRPAISCSGSITLHLSGVDNTSPQFLQMKMPSGSIKPVLNSAPSVLPADMQLSTFNWLPEWNTPVMLSDGGLSATSVTEGRETQRVVGDVVWTTGRHYFEISFNSEVNESYVGVIPSDSKHEGLMGYQADGWAFSTFEGAICHGGGGDRNVYPYGERLLHDGADRVGILVDMDQKTIEFSRRGRLLGVAFKNLPSAVRPAASFNGTITVHRTLQPATV